jgi:hypothetical protein
MRYGAVSLPSRHEQDGHSDDGGKEAEVRVGVPVVDECLDAKAGFGDPQMTMEHGPRLKVVEIVVGDASERVDGAGEEVPRQPHEERHDDGRPHDHGDGEPLAAQLDRRERGTDLGLAERPALDHACGALDRAWINGLGH